jgi:hypothetical protein
MKIVSAVMDKQPLYRLDKPKGRQFVQFVPDPSNDSWILVQWIEKKSLKRVRECTIIRKDIPSWIQYMTGALQWEITQNNNS